MQSKTSADTLLKLKKNINISKCMVYIIFLVVLSLFAIFIGGSFFSLNNILNIIRQTAVVSMIAVTMTFVIAIGEIDLSVGSMMCALGAVLSYLCSPVVLVVIITLTSYSFLSRYFGKAPTTSRWPFWRRWL